MSITPAIRGAVAQKFNLCCAYCLSQQNVAGVQYTVDHIIPKALGGSDDIDNLCLACSDCNRAKYDRIVARDLHSGDIVPLFHPVQDDWRDHFCWRESGLWIEGKTAVGRATVEQLQLNRPLLRRSRTLWIRVGWHPPVDSL